MFYWGKHEEQKDEHRHYGDDFTCEFGMYPITLSGGQYDDDYYDEEIGNGKSACIIERADRDNSGVYTTSGGYAEYLQ